jgi:hypothetical protein
VIEGQVASTECILSIGKSGWGDALSGRQLYRTEINTWHGAEPDHLTEFSKFL